MSLRGNGAERADGEFEQHVAIKLIGAGAFSADMVERFRAEHDRVVHEAKRSAAVTEYLQSIFEISSLDESLGELVSAKDVLECGAKRLQVELYD